MNWWNSFYLDSDEIYLFLRKQFKDIRRRYIFWHKTGDEHCIREQLFANKNGWA